MKSHKIMNLVIATIIVVMNNNNNNNNNNNDNTTQSKLMYENNHMTSFWDVPVYGTRQKSELPAWTQKLLTEREEGKHFWRWAAAG